jgi:hypothetical protein
MLLLEPGVGERRRWVSRHGALCACVVMGVGQPFACTLIPENEGRGAHCSPLLEGSVSGCSNRLLPLCCWLVLQSFKAAVRSPFEIDASLLAREQPGLVLTQVGHMNQHACCCLTVKLLT